MKPHSGYLVWRWKGHKMVGVQHRPALRSGRKAPGVLFLHGFPGSEKNVDVQRALMERGIASFAPHFAGAWGSDGDYRFSTLVSQARRALGVLASFDCVNPRRLAVFGFSMGGWAALNLAGAVPSLAGAVAVAPAGGPEMVTPDSLELLTRLSRPLDAAPPSSLLKDFKEAVRRHDPARAVSRPGCPLLLVHGDQDEVVPYPVSRRLAALAGKRARLVTARGADHAFLDRRPWLTRLSAGWLAERLGC